MWECRLNNVTCCYLINAYFSLVIDELKQLWHLPRRKLPFKRKISGSLSIKQDKSLTLQQTNSGTIFWKLEHEDACDVRKKIEPYAWLFTPNVRQNYSSFLTDVSKLTLHIYDKFRVAYRRISLEKTHWPQRRKHLSSAEITIHFPILL